MMERIIWCAGPVNDRMSTIVQAQLMFLDSIGMDDITLTYIIFNKYHFKPITSSMIPYFKAS